MSTFALQLAEFAKKAAERADQLVGEIVVGVAARIDARSPVGDAKYWKSPPPPGYVGGRFRGNWQLGIGSIPAGALARIDHDGTVALPAIIAGVPDDAAGKVYYIANNLPYAQAIEDGHSRQAPAGVVGRTAVEFQQIVRDAIETKL
jgi:hypothetical protein